MANADIQKLIQQGVEAARAGNKAKARELFQKATEADMNNERAWLWLATVTDDPQQKRIHIENVLHINPDNERAQQMLLQMGDAGKGTAKKKKAGELAPGVPRGQVLLVGGVALVLWLALLTTFIVIGSNRRAAFRQVIATTAQAVADAGATQTEQRLGETATADAVTATAAADIAATATAVILAAQTERAAGGDVGLQGVSRTDLPPTWTPTPLPADFVPTETPNFGPTITPLPLELPRDQFGGNILVSWGGLDELNRDFLRIYAYQLDTGNNRQLGAIRVQGVDISPANGQELVYTVYYPETFGFGIEISNLTVTSRRLLSQAWEPLDSVFETQQVSFSPDGSKIVFIAPVTRDFNVINQIFLLDLDQPPAPNTSPLRAITNDAANYAAPAVSPDNTRIVAIKEDPQAFDTGPDLVIIDVETGEQTALNPNGSATIEDNPAWVLPDGNEIAYAARVEADPNPTFNIIRLNPDTPGAPAQFLVREPAYNANYPVFSSDGRYMAFADDRGGAYNIFILEVATGTVYQLTNDNDNDDFPGGWYQPGVVAERGQAPLPTPVVLEEDDAANPDS